MSLRYLEDLPLGVRFDCGAFCFSRDEIVAFARQFDPQPFHIDDAAAERSYFKGLCASGVHTQAAAIGLLVRAIADVAVVAGGSLDQARFFVPVRAGRRYAVTAWWQETRVSARDPARGVAVLRGVAVGEDGAEVMAFGVTYIVATR